MPSTLDEDGQLGPKLRTAIERMVGGKLKENHDDTLFEKLCHLIGHELPAEQLAEFELWPLLSDALPKSTDEQRDGERLVMVLRIVSALCRHRRLVQLYLVQQPPAEMNMLTFVRRLVIKFECPERVEEQHGNAKKLLYSLCHLLESISQCPEGLVWCINQLIIEPPTPALFCLVAQLLHPGITVYIKEKIYRILRNLIRFRFRDTPSSSSAPEASAQAKESFDVFMFDSLMMFNNQVSSHPVPSNAPIIISTSKTGSIWPIFTSLLGHLSSSSKTTLARTFVEHYNIITFIETNEGSTPADDNLSALFARLAWLFNENGDVSDLLLPLLDNHIERLYATHNCFRLFIFLVDTYGLYYEIGDGTVSQRDFTMKYMHRLISIVAEHNDFDTLTSMWNELPARDKRFLTDTLVSMPYKQFEFETFRLLNRLSDTGRLSHLYQFDLLTSGLLKALRKLEDGKHLRMLWRFIEGLAERNRDHERICGQLLFTFNHVLREDTRHAHIILKIVRQLYPRMGEIYNRMFYIHYVSELLDVANEHFGEADMLDDDTGDLVEMFLETIYQLFLHLDFRAFLDFDRCPAVRELAEAVNRTIRYLLAFLESNAFHGARALMMTTLHVIELKAVSVKCLGEIERFEWRKVLAEFDDWELTARQTFVLNQKGLLEMNPTMRMIDGDEMFFYCRHLMEESDCELQIELIDIVSLLVNYRFDVVEANQELIEWFAKAKVIPLGLELATATLASPRIQAIGVKFHESFQEQLLGRASEEEIRRWAVDVELGVLEDFFRVSPAKEAGGEAMEEGDGSCGGSGGDYPSLHLLDDIICAINDDELVMDCY